jgi:hypothetical protein
MNSKFTQQLKRKAKRLLFVTSFFLLTGLNSFAQNPFDPWCNWIDNTNNGNLVTYMSAIEEILITEGNNVVYNKAPDGYQWGGANPSSSGQVLNTATNPLTLNAGSTYRLGVSFSCRMNSYTSSGWNAWIDYNNNKTYDANESLATSFTPGPHTMNAGPGAMVFITFTLPCNVTEDVTRLRIKCSYAGQVVNATVGCATTAAFLYGEAEDLHIKVLKPTSLSANFIVPTNVWVGSPTTFFNLNKVGYITHQWDKDLNGYEFTGLDYTTTFNTPGTSFLKLRSTNCLGTDSVVKTINVLAPTNRPNTDFIANRTVLEDGDEVTLYDLSTFGPTSWDWLLEDQNNPFTSQDNSYIIGGSQIGGSYYRAIFEMFDIGKFDVTLESSNTQGTGSKTKMEYITVNPFSEFWLGAGAQNTQIGKGTIFDKGGPNANYATGNNGDPTVNRLRIQPCGAEEIELKITQFKFGSASHNFKVWDGPNPMNGIPLHPAGGFTRNNTSAPMTLVAKSGSMYMELDTRASGTVDSGLIATFTTKYGPTGPPIPSFKLSNQEVAFTRAPTKIQSTSANIYGLAGFAWTVNGMSVMPNQVSEEGRLLTYAFPTAGKYNVCLDITSCTGDGNFCDTITVINPTTPTNLDFNADVVRPGLNETVTFTSNTDKADRFRWTITPFDYNFQQGTNLTSKDLKVQFTKTGAYTVSLRAWNSLDSAATTRFLVKDKYIIVINPCTPVASILSSDVSNAYLEITDANNNVIFSRNTTTGVTDYETFLNANDEPIYLYFGATYNVKMRRNSNADPASRAAYLDFNIDGEFMMNERILHQVNSNDLEVVSQFTVPANTVAFAGETRLRTVVSYANGSTAACGPITSGEFEDHKVIIRASLDHPVITMLGSDTVRVEVGTTYSDASATAMDAIEGNITSKMVTTNDLDINQTGIYSYLYEVTNASGLSATPRRRFVLVTVDQTAPVLNLFGNLSDTVEVFSSSSYNEPGFTAIDLVDGNLTSVVSVSGSVDMTKLGNYTLTYTVSDIQGNKTVLTRNVVVVDRTAPEIVFIGTERIQINTFWYDQTFATDNYWKSNDVQLSIAYGFNGPVRWDVKGVYPVTYTAVDGSGNMTVVNKTYIVDDFIAPTITLNTADTVMHEVRTAYNSVNVTVKDNYYSSSQVSLTKTSNVNANVLGKYEEKFRAIDGSGNITERSRWVKVIDTKAPVIYAAPICSKLGIDFNPLHGVVVEDNYYTQAELLPLVEIRESNVNPFSVGNYRALYMVTDPSGNTSNYIWRSIEISEACELVTGIENIENNKVFTVYPNPSNGLFTVRFLNNMENAESIEVVNAVGTTIKNVKVNTVNGEQTIDLTDEANGIYLVKVTSKGSVSTQRVTVAK